MKYSYLSSLVLLLFTIVFAQSLWSQDNGCEECLYVTIPGADCPATVYATWTESNELRMDTLAWQWGDTLTLSCAPNLTVLADASWAISCVGDTVALDFWYAIPLPIVETVFEQTDNPNLVGRIDTVLEADCRETHTVYLYTPPNEGFLCGTAIRNSGGGYRHEMSFPLGSGNDIMIDFLAYGIPDTLIILAAGEVVFMEAVGSRRGASIPQGSIWDNGSIRRFEGYSPVFENSFGRHGFLRLILDVQDNCDLQIIVQSNRKRRTAWRLYVHCCPQCYQPPLKVANVDTVLCFEGTIKGQYVAQDTTINYLSQTKGNCDSLTVFNVHVAKPRIDSFAVQGATCFGYNDGRARSFPNAEAPLRYEWSNGTVTNENSNLLAGNYTLTLTDRHGCQTEDSTRVGEPPILDGYITGQEPNCYGESSGQLTATAFGGTPIYRFQWPEEQTSPILTGVPTGWYTLTLTDAHNCTATLDYFLDQPDTLIAQLAQVPASCLGVADGELEALSTGGTPLYTYQWSNADTNYLTVGLLSGRYTLTVTDTNGCTDTEETELGTEFLNQVFVPDAFSPNFDGDNDTFLPFASPCVVQFTDFQVYDRWGALMFRAQQLAPDDVALMWDGTHRGKVAPTGVYTWYLKVEYYYGWETLQGSVFLRR